MQRRGYRFLTMAAFVQELAAGRPPDRICALTFDDGTEDHLTELKPVLEELRCPGPSTCARASRRGLSLVRSSRRRAADARGGGRRAGAQSAVEIGSHTLRHTVLENASEEEAYREMATCKQALEDSSASRSRASATRAAPTRPPVPRPRAAAVHERGHVRPARWLAPLRAQARELPHAGRPAHVRAEIARPLLRPDARPPALRAGPPGRCGTTGSAPDVHRKRGLGTRRARRRHPSRGRARDRHRLVDAALPHHRAASRGARGAGPVARARAAPDPPGRQGGGGGRRRPGSRRRDAPSWPSGWDLRSRPLHRSARVREGADQHPQRGRLARH